MSRKLVVIGASAGGLEPLLSIVSALPAGIPLALCVAVHIPESSQSNLPEILARSGPLPAAHALDGEELRPGKIYVAPAGRHLLVEDGRLRLTLGPRENGFRPAIDPLFRSAALAHGPGAIGVVLSGALDDGAAGLAAIKERGGLALVQDPAEALVPGMPQRAILSTPVDHIAPAAELGRLLARIAPLPITETRMPVPDPALEFEVRASTLPEGTVESPEAVGIPASIACPSCGGTLWELKGKGPLRYRCRTGHAYSPVALLHEQLEVAQSVLGAAVRVLKERAALCEELSQRFGQRGDPRLAERFAADANEARRQSQAAVALVSRLSGAGSGGGSDEPE